MATNNSRMVTLPFGPQGARATVTMTLGAALFLGFKREDISPGTTTVQLSAKNYRRAAWMGGPLLPVNRPEQSSVRQIGSMSSRARTNKRLILDAGNTQETVYFTGTQAEVVSFLVDKCRAENVVIRSKTGRNLMPVLPKGETV